jgi:hypothetical protein
LRLNWRRNPFTTPLSTWHLLAPTGNRNNGSNNNTWANHFEQLDWSMSGLQESNWWRTAKWLCWTNAK